MLFDGVYDAPPEPKKDPPEDAVYHPLNVYAGLLGVGRVVEDPAFTVAEAGLTDPPFALKVTVY